MRVSLLLLAAALSFASSINAANEATAVLGTNTGVYLSKWPSGTVTNIYGAGSAQKPRISPDGRQIAFMGNGGTIWFMNNDGAGLTSTGQTQEDFPENLNFAFTSNGILWANGGRIHRYNTATKTHSLLNILLDTIGANTCSAGEYRDPYTGTGAVFCSSDGHKMWLNPSYNSGLPGYACGQGGYCDGTDVGRGSRPYLVFSSDFSNCTIVGWGGDWGHGRLMSASGYMMFIQLGEHRTWNPVVQFDQNTAPTIVYGSTGYGESGSRGTGNLANNCDPFNSGKPGISPPFTSESRYNAACVNNDSLICSNNPSHVLYNWRTTPPSQIGTFATAPGDLAKDAGCYGCYGVSDFFWGPLPTANQPFIVTNPTSLVFNVTGTTNPASQVVNITNSASTALTAVSATVTTSGATWLGALVVGGSGNAQTVTVSVNAANLSADVSTATIRISGGGASNTVDVQVTANRNVLAAPSNLAATPVGDSLLDVALTWKDNSPDESGFIIQRKTLTGTYAEVTRTAANAVSYTDLHLAMGTFVYRVCAFKTGQQSAFCTEDTVSVIGKAWIRVTAPTAGQNVTAKTTFRVKWTSNLITSVNVRLSLDDGLSYQLLNTGGGIVPSSADWNNYPWQVPDTQCAALIRAEAYSGTPASLPAPITITKSAVAAPFNHTSDAIKPSIALSPGLLTIQSASGAWIAVQLLAPDGSIIGRAIGNGHAEVRFAKGQVKPGVYIVKGAVGAAPIRKRIILFCR